MLREWIGFIVAIIVLIGLPLSCSIQQDKERAICESQEAIIKEYKLVSLFDYENVYYKSTLSGGFFLMMGAISGQSVSDLKYYIRYAYEDEHGVKLMTEEISNSSNIRIKEVANKLPKVIIKHKKEYHPIPINAGNTCHDEEIIRIFEIPKGTMYKTFEMDMK